MSETLKLRAKDITQAIVRELLEYDQDTGILRWKDRDRRWFLSKASQKQFQSKFAGKIAGSRCSKGYIHVSIANRLCKAHRVIWLWMTGEWPQGLIDHENHVRDDNRWSNLRSVSPLGNSQNKAVRSDNTSGTAGVVLHKSNQKWAARIKINGKRVSLGEYFDKADAIEARKAAEKLYGFHPNHGSPNKYGGGHAG